MALGDSISAQEFGRLQGEVLALRTDMDRMIGDIAEIKKSMHEISAQLSEAKGGWKTLMLVGGAASSLGAVGAWFATHFKWVP